MSSIIDTWSYCSFPKWMHCYPICISIRHAITYISINSDSVSWLWYSISVSCERAMWCKSIPSIVISKSSVIIYCRISFIICQINSVLPCMGCSFALPSCSIIVSFYSTDTSSRISDNSSICFLKRILACIASCFTYIFYITFIIFCAGCSVGYDGCA